MGGEFGLTDCLCYAMSGARAERRVISTVEVKRVGGGGSKDVRSEARDDAARQLSGLALVCWLARVEARYSVIRRDTGGFDLMAFVVIVGFFDGGWCWMFAVGESWKGRSRAGGLKSGRRQPHESWRSYA